MNATTQQTELSRSQNRFHGLDAARAIALLIGIVHHGIESFVTYAKGDWITQDKSSSMFLDVVFYVSHVFRMQAFFLISGFFAHMIYQRSGWKEFIVNRGRRLLLPFVIFWPVLYILTLKIWIWGVQYFRGSSYEEAVKSLPGYMQLEQGFPLMHLWFLYFLILFCVGAAIVRPVIDSLDKSGAFRKKIDRIISFVMSRRWGVLLIGLFMILPMLGMTDWLGVDTSASGLVPRLFPFLLYGLYFTLGWFLHRQSGLMNNFVKFRISNLILSAFTILAVIAISLLFGDSASPEDSQKILRIINTIYAFASVTTAFAFIGYCMKWFENYSPAIRYLADGAYWGYLIHLPIVGLFQIVVASLNLVWSVKLMLIFLPTCFLLWITYKFFVRSTIIGVLLNGVKK